MRKYRQKSCFCTFSVYNSAKYKKNSIKMFCYYIAHKLKLFPNIGNNYCCYDEAINNKTFEAKMIFPSIFLTLWFTLTHFLSWKEKLFKVLKYHRKKNGQRIEPFKHIRILKYFNLTKNIVYSFCF